MNARDVFYLLMLKIYFLIQTLKLGFIKNKQFGVLSLFYSSGIHETNGVASRQQSLWSRNSLEKSYANFMTLEVTVLLPVNQTIHKFIVPNKSVS